MRIEQSPEFQIHLQTLKSKEQIFLETIYNVGNGHFGVRDSNPLQGNNPDYIGSPGLFINGFFDYKEVSYGENTVDILTIIRLSIGCLIPAQFESRLAVRIH